VSAAAGDNGLKVAYAKLLLGVEWNPDVLLRVLRPGGRLFILDGWPDHWLGQIIYDLVIGCVEGGVQHCSSEDMRRLLQSAGFTALVQKWIYSPFPLLVTSGSVPLA